MALRQPKPALSEVRALRRFNRFYTRSIGVLDKKLANSPFTLTQARVLFELDRRQTTTAGEIAETLSLDVGYLSRILRAFSAQGLLDAHPSAEDARRILLSLTIKGRRAFRTLNRKTETAASALLGSLPRQSRSRFLQALGDAEALLSNHKPEPSANIVIRPHQLGDIGWAIELHARLYADEYGWNAEFEALVATLFARFASGHDPRKERFWIAELDGRRVGCVFVARNEKDPTAAQLRCILVAPEGRGRGLGRRLIAQCVKFSRAAGYRKVILWTNDILQSARRLYEAAGFTLVSQKPHRSFGHNLVGQVWSLDLFKNHS